MCRTSAVGSQGCVHAQQTLTCTAPTVGVPGTRKSAAGVNVVAVADGVDDARWRRRTFGEREVFADPYVWLGQVDVELADGGRYWHDVVRLHRAVVVALVDGDARVLMQRRHRFILDKWGWELPGGLVDEDEGDAEAAARVLEDETGFRAQHLELLASFQPIPGRMEAQHAVFVARAGERVGEPMDAGEAPHVEWVRLEHARELVAAGDIWHGASLVGVLHLIAFGPVPPQSRVAGLNP